MSSIRPTEQILPAYRAGHTAQLVTGDALLCADPRVSAYVLLAGVPSSGKGVCALIAERAKASAYQVHSPKAGIVGEAERRARILTMLLAEMAPNVLFIDEITEADGRVANAAVGEPVVRITEPLVVPSAPTPSSRRMRVPTCARIRQ